MPKLRNLTLRNFLFLIIVLVGLLGFYYASSAQHYFFKNWDHGICLKELQVSVLPFRAKSFSSLANALRMSEKYTEDVRVYRIVHKIKESGQDIKRDDTITKALARIEKIDNLYRKSIEKDGKNARFFFDYALFLEDLDRNEIAIKTFKKSIELNPNQKDAYFGLISLYGDLKIRTESISLIKDMLNRFRGNEDVLVSLVMTTIAYIPQDTQSKEFTRLFEDIFKELVKTIDSKKPKASSFYNLGLIYTKIGEFDRAISAYRRALDLDSRHADTLYNLANLYKDSGRNVEAVALYQKAIKVNPKKIEAYFNLGNIYWRDGKSELAKETYQKTLNIDSFNPKAYYHLGIIEELTGNKDKALKLYEKSIEIDPTLANVWVNMGNIYTAMNERDKALECYQNSVKNDKNFLVGWLKLFALTFENKQYELSAKYLNEAVLLGYDAPQDALDALSPYM